ncbi:unnamed protein product [marine sediment metagenome]|uniref:Uncharacterized protein n=1 Tax=marine sediment metagenome TaxID=412755 RepID=X0YKC4_9ZZZZ
MQFCDNAFGHGNLCVSRADVQPGPGQYYESDYLAMARPGLFQKAGGQKQLQEIDAAEAIHNG